MSSVNGCDSIITLVLSVTNPVSLQISDSICPGGSYSFHGRNLTATGIYHDTLTAAGGCDSVVTLNLAIAAAPVASIYHVGRDSLFTTPFSSHQWLKNNVTISGATSEDYRATSSGLYTVIVANEDNSVIAKGYCVINALVAFERKKYQVSLTVGNILNTKWNEAQFETLSKLRGEDHAVNTLNYTAGTLISIKFDISYFSR
jgi:hypothetical protein